MSVSHRTGGTVLKNRLRIYLPWMYRNFRRGYFAGFVILGTCRLDVRWECTGLKALVALSLPSRTHARHGRECSHCYWQNSASSSEPWEREVAVQCIQPPIISPIQNLMKETSANRQTWTHSLYAPRGGGEEEWRMVKNCPWWLEGGRGQNFRETSHSDPGSSCKNIFVVLSSHSIALSFSVGQTIY